MPFSDFPKTFFSVYQDKSYRYTAKKKKIQLKKVFENYMPTEFKT